MDSPVTTKLTDVPLVIQERANGELRYLTLSTVNCVADYHVPIYLVILFNFSRMYNTIYKVCQYKTIP